ncbi:MAG: 1-acyl-sn-glycerol-3-phosphate acyltransferase [Clostridia bacterium]|nr:1-acyl-sn-glycerol-3-phosphate acyltransferase [Clostridia bacterium]
MVADKRKSKQWIFPRHAVVRNLLYLPLLCYTKLAYHIKIEKFCDEQKRPYLILFNHQTAFDQFFVSLSFKQHVYYVASEDLFSNGWVSRLITWLVAPIPFRKSTSDITAVKNCLRIAKEGGSIGMAPEGNRTYSGTTEHIKPSVAALAKALGLPIAIYRIEGGFGVHPRWSDTLRRGKMRSYVSRVIEPEEYASMSKEELFAIIKQELYVDERKDTSNFYHKCTAEYLERVLYYCPFCGLSIFDSKNDTVTCRRCLRTVQYLPNKTLKGVGFDFPYTTLKDWYDAQCQFVINVDTSLYGDSPLYSDAICFQESIYCKNKVKIDKNATLTLYADRIVVETAKETYTFSFTELSAATVLGKNKLNLYKDNRVFQCKGKKQFNAVKYLNFYYRTLNVEEEGNNGRFLGL